MHFKLDENVPLQLVPFLKEFLKEEKYPVSTIFSEKLSGISDSELGRLCQKEKYVLITLDNDFSNLQLYPPALYEGIIVIRLKSQGINSVIGAFRNLLSSFDLADVKNSCIVVESDHIRVRK